MKSKQRTSECQGLLFKKKEEEEEMFSVTTLCTESDHHLVRETAILSKCFGSVYIVTVVGFFLKTIYEDFQSHLLTELTVLMQDEYKRGDEMCMGNESG